jgi:two-component system, OmpR family, alkaline phosphatase synthesis response regulator PhoP
VEKILVVEDDQAIQKALRRLFEAEDYRIEVAGDGRSGLNAFRSSPPSLIILDLRLPGISGRDVCCEMKGQSPSIPIIVLSAVTDVADKVLMLEMGADDYVTKPFSPRELLARARVAMRRSARPQAAAECFTFGDVTVDFATMELTCNGQPVALTAHEFKLLKFFVENQNRVISREELLREVWGYQNYPTTRTVDNHILKLRQKLEKSPAFPTHFRTMHGAGYKFIP